MTNSKDNLHFPDDGCLAEDETDFDARKASTASDKWRVLIVDDEEDIHQATQLAFAVNQYTYQGKPLEFLSARSAQEAKELLHQYPDIAVILLDVVMETNDAGLKLVEYLRDTLQNRLVRIILRTGQPGSAPEQEVIAKYEINDYQNKTELSTSKLYTVVTAGIRAYSELKQLDSLRQHLEETVAEQARELEEKYNEILILNQELKKNNQEKDEFLGMVAHLRNPLSAIQGLSALITSEYDSIPSEEVIEVVEKISGSSHQMSELITTLLDVKVIDSGNLHLSLTQIDVLPILQAVVETHEERAEAKNLTLHFEPVAASYIAWGDKNICHQILDNLLFNAIKYSPFDTNIVIRLHQKDQSICCEIQDEGPGLSEQDQQKLFGKFTRLSTQPMSKEHSTGLRLFVVKKLVEAMNGKVWCESELGRGTMFVVELPVARS